MSYAVQQYFLNGGTRRADRARPQRRARRRRSRCRPASTWSPRARATGARRCASASTTTRDRGAGRGGRQPVQPARSRTPATGDGRALPQRLDRSRPPPVRRRACWSRSRTSCACAAGTVPAARPTRSGAPPAGRRPARGPGVVDGIRHRRRRRRAARRRADLGPGARGAAKRGLWLLEQADLFNLLCIPPLRPATPDVAQGDVGRRGRLRASARARWSSSIRPRPGTSRPTSSRGRRRRRALATRDDERGALLPAPPRRRSAAREPARRLRARAAPSPASIARTDAQRGVWKAPAGHRRRR